MSFGWKECDGHRPGKENVGKRKDELKLRQACVLKERKQEQSEGDERPFYIGIEASRRVLGLNKALHHDRS